MAKPVIKPYTPFLLDPSARFSLWPSNFEGMKATKTIKMQFGFLDLMKTMLQQLCSKNGNARSSGRCFMEGLNQLLKLDEAWIKKKKRNTIYTSIYDCNWSRCNCKPIG
jgi:branched-chain amino acid aminotransferase